MGIGITKKMAKNFSWLLTGNIISGLINFLMIVYLARVLGSAAFGLLQFAMAFLVYLVLLVDSGLSLLGTREIAMEKERAGDISLNIFAVRLLIALVIFFISSIILFSTPLSAEMRLLFFATFLFVFYRAFNADWVFQGLEKMEYIALSKVLFSVLSFILIIFLVKGAGDLVKVPIVQFVFGIAVSITFLLLLFKYLVPVNFRLLHPGLWSGYFFQALPLGASIILIQIYNNLDTIMLGFMDKPSVVGYYNAAYKIFYVFVGLFATWQSTAIPVVSKRISGDLPRAKAFLEKYLRLTLLAVLPAVILTFLASPMIINLVFGSEYLEAALALRILIWALMALIVGSIYGVTILIPAGYFNAFFAAVALGAVVNIILNFILIPPFSFCGAAVATIIAEISAGTLAIYLSRRVLYLGLIRNLIKPFFISLFSLIPFGIIYLLFFPMSEFIRVLLGCLAFVLFYLLALLVMERDFIFEFVREIIGRQ